MRSHQGVKLITSLLLLKQNTIRLNKEKEFISVQTFDIVGMRYVKSYSTNPILGIKGVVRYLIKCLISISIFSSPNLILIHGVRLFAESVNLAIFHDNMKST